MKALRLALFGSPSLLRIEELGIPESGKGEALVHVKAAAIKPSDIMNIAEHFKNTTLPRTPGQPASKCIRITLNPADGEEPLRFSRADLARNLERAVPRVP
jgi:hypothetical protein